jgi:hypothetical protein
LSFFFSVETNFKHIVEIPVVLQKIFAYFIIELSIKNPDMFARVFKDMPQRLFVFCPQELCAFAEEHSESFAVIKVAVELEDPVEVTQLLSEFFYILG